MEKIETLNWDIEEWLENLGLDEYVDLFIDNGYDIPKLVASMTDNDLDAMHINVPEHRKLLLKEAAKIPKDKPPAKPKRTFKFNAKKEAPDIKVQTEGLSRLQLKLKVSAELKSDKLEITAPPYATAEGQADTPALLGLSRKYSEKFKVKVEDTYNIIMEIWRGRKEAEVNLKSVFSPEVQTPVTSPSIPGPTENYDEIFTMSTEKKPVRVRKKTSTDLPPIPHIPMAQVSDIQADCSSRPFSPSKNFEKLRQFLESFDRTSYTPESSPSISFRFDDNEIWNGTDSVPETVKIDLMTQFCQRELSVDQMVEKLAQLTGKKTSLTAFDNDVVLSVSTVETPVRKNGAIRTTSECSGDNSPKTSLGRSTDSDSCSPSGSPEVTRKKRIWERNGKVKETFMALQDSEESSEDAKKDKERKHNKSKFFHKVTKKLFKTRSKSKSTAEGTSLDDKENIMNMTRAQSSPAIAGENDVAEVVDDTFGNYSQPFDSIEPSKNMVKLAPVASGSKLPARYTPKHVNTLPHDFSPSNVRKGSPSSEDSHEQKSPSLEGTPRRKISVPNDKIMGKARLNGNTNCSVDSDCSSVLSSESLSTVIEISPLDRDPNSIPEVPPRAYTPPPEEDVVVPPRQGDYHITVDQDSNPNQKLDGGEGRGVVSPVRTIMSPRRTTPVSDLPPVTEETCVTTSDPPPKPKRHQRRSGTLSFSENTTPSPQPVREIKEPTFSESLPQRSTPDKEESRDDKRDQASPKPGIARKPTKLKKMMQVRMNASDNRRSSSPADLPTAGHKEASPPGHPVELPIQKSQVTVNIRHQRVTSPRRAAPPPPIHSKQRTTVSESAAKPTVNADSAPPMSRSATFGAICAPVPPPRERNPTAPVTYTQRRHTQSPNSPILPPKPKGLLGKKSRSLENLLDDREERIDNTNRPTLPPKPAVVPIRPPKSSNLRNLVRPVSEVPQSWREQAQAGSVSGIHVENHRPWNTPPSRRSPRPQVPQKLLTRPTIPPKPIPRAKSPSPPERNEAIKVLEKKLLEEGICLSDPPYSDSEGECGIPLTLARRYSMETQLRVDLVGESLDFIRLDLLQQLNRPACAASKLYWKTDQEISTSSVDDWLISISLPFYRESFKTAGVFTVREIPFITHDQMKMLDLWDPSHNDYIYEGIRHLRTKMLQK
jgi:hypothetical protein